MIYHTPDQRAAFRALADYLNTGLPEYTFRMRAYVETRPECGTCACALGHLPYVLGREREVFDGARLNEFLIAQEESLLFADNNASDRIVAFGQRTLGLNRFQEAFCFLFGGTWPDDPRLAAARIYYYLERGTPDHYRWPSPAEPWNNPAPLPFIAQAQAATKEHHNEPADL